MHSTPPKASNHLAGVIVKPGYRVVASSPLPTEPPARANAYPAATGTGNLLLNVAELASLLADALQRRAWLDAYLCAAGMNQVAEDHIHRDINFVGAIGDQLLSSGGQPRAVVGRTAAMAMSGALDLRSCHRSSRDLLSWQRNLAMCVDTLAGAVSASVAGAAADPTGVAAKAEAALSAVAGVPAALREQIPRLPSCFHAFDLDVSDVLRLAVEFERAWPDRSRPLLVAGIRTSGSYLAPLCATFLGSHGYADVRVLTLRPQHQLLRSERDLVRRIARGDGLALVIDDPPESGRSVARIAQELARLGLPHESIVLILPLFGSRDAVPARLRRYPSVLLPSDEWAINSKLTPGSVGRALGRLVPPGVSVEGVEPLPLSPRDWRRSHDRGLFRVDLLKDARTRTVSVLVEGVGTGYYGEHALLVASALHDYVPEVFGLADGCLYRTWLSDERQVCPPGSAPDEELVNAVATYVAARKRALRVQDDRSLGAVGERPVWEVVGLVLSRVFGRGAQASRLLLVNGLAKELLRVTRPSVVDGATALSNWFADEGSRERYVKVDFAKRSFWNLGLICYDAAFDLAGAALSSPSEATADQLRSKYTRRVGESIGEERWLLYELAHLWGAERIGPEHALELQRRSAQSLQRFFARLFLADLGPAQDGPLCALDLDGVLETESLGFPATTSSGAMALRALIAHGYRPVLASGRSAGEVADRCRSYRLAGGAAEYGAVVCTTAPEHADVLLSDAEQDLLACVRATLASRHDVHVDDAFCHAVRAFRVDRRGKRGPLDRQTVNAVLAASGDPALIRPVMGEGQTDFVAAGVDKGRAVRALAARLGQPDNGDGRLLALAVGDTAADLPMLGQATLAFAPANAQATLRREGVEVLSAPCQAGLAQAVERLLGHEPGACPACRAPQLSPEAALLVEVLSAGERGRVELARRFLQLRRRVRASTS
jgi:haloacid dehalogenase-like hydrolase